jgi:ABC-2 type transport system permease protein
VSAVAPATGWSLGVAAAIAGVTWRGLLGRRRTLLMVLLAAVPILLGLLNRAAGNEAIDLGAVLDFLVIRTVLPLIALVFGTAAIGSEIEDGTAIHLLTKPIPRSIIVVVKLLVAAVLTALLVVPSTVLGGLILGSTAGDAPQVTFAYAVASLVGSFVYVAIFVALSIFTTRGLLIGLTYVVVWEGALSSLLPGTEAFSVHEYLLGIAATIQPGSADADVGAGGFGLSLLVLVLAAIAGSARLARFEVRGTD